MILHLSSTFISNDVDHCYDKVLMTMIQLIHNEEFY